MRELSLFTGAGGGLTGSALLGWESIGYVEFNDYCQRAIRQRIEDGIFPRAPIFGDIRTFTSEGYARRYRGVADVVTAGFPCQPFSSAGKRQGENDERNMWPATADVLREIRPKFALLENVPGLFTNKYIRRIFGDLAEMGLHARWCVLGGFSTGNITNGERLWIVAHEANQIRCPFMDSYKDISVGSKESFTRLRESAVSRLISQDDYSRIGRGSDALARGIQRLEAIGNGQMGPVAATAWQTLTGKNQ